MTRAGLAAVSGKRLEVWIKKRLLGRDTDCMVRCGPVSGNIRVDFLVAFANAQANF